MSLIRTGLGTKKITKSESPSVTFERQRELDREIRSEMTKKWKGLTKPRLDQLVPDPDVTYDVTTGKMFGVQLMVPGLMK